MRVKTVGDLVLNEDAVISVQQLTPKIVLSVGVSFFFFFFKFVEANLFVEAILIVYSCKTDNYYCDCCQLLRRS